MPPSEGLVNSFLLDYGTDPFPFPFSGVTGKILSVSTVLALTEAIFDLAKGVEIRESTRTGIS